MMLRRLFGLAILLGLPMFGFVMLTGFRTIFDSGNTWLFVASGIGTIFTFLGFADLLDSRQPPPK